MEGKVLVAYASLCGSTAEVAEEAAHILEAHGADVRVCDVDDVTNLDDYGAVVLGTAIRMGRAGQTDARLHPAPRARDC